MSEYVEPVDRMDCMEWRRGEYTISTDPARIDFDVVHGFLANESYWSRGIPAEILRRAIAESLNFGVYDEARQVGFARVVTDRATFAYFCDVFIVPEYRGRGLSKWLMETVAAHPDLQACRRWMLATHDAHTLYMKVGFTPVSTPERWMERRLRNPYGVEMG